MTDPAWVAYYPEKARTFDLFAILLTAFLPKERRCCAGCSSGRSCRKPTSRPAFCCPAAFMWTTICTSQDAQNRLVTDAVERYCKGYQLYVKTHPRDTTDYEQLLPDAVVLDRFMPSELLDYCFEVRFARAVGLCTASVRNLQCADENFAGLRLYCALPKGLIGCLTGGLPPRPEPVFGAANGGCAAVVRSAFGGRLAVQNPLWFGAGSVLQCN